MTNKPFPEKGRIWELDALRGMMILCVILIHLLFDLQYFLSLSFSFPQWLIIIQDNGGILFILLSGICATLGSKCFRRGLIVFSCALLVTAATCALYLLGAAGRDIIIHFGILHLLGCSMMLYALFKRLPTLFTGIIGLLLIILGYFLLYHRTSCPYLFVFGLRYRGYTASDYFPLFPYFGWFLIGSVLGKTLYRSRSSHFPGRIAGSRCMRFFRFCGRNSLVIYLSHQPVCYGLVLVISVLMKGM